MKSIYIFICILLSYSCYSQISFQESSDVISGVFGSGSDFGDIDNDGDLDFVISGYDSNTTRVTKLYLNNNGTYIEDTSNSIIGVLGDVKFEDIDNDNDLDLFIIGSESASNRIAKLYINNAGTFTEDTSNIFDGHYRVK